MFPSFEISAFEGTFQNSIYTFRLLTLYLGGLPKKVNTINVFAPCKNVNSVDPDQTPSTPIKHDKKSFLPHNTVLCQYVEPVQIVPELSIKNKLSTYIWHDQRL